MSTYKQTTKSWNVEITETKLVEDFSLADDETKKCIIVKLNNQNEGFTKEAFDTLLTEATRQFSEYRILHCPEGLFIEGK